MHPVVGVHPRDQRAAAAGEPKVERRDEPAPLAAHDPDRNAAGSCAGRALQHLRRPVGGAIVDADQLPRRRAALGEKPFERLRQGPGGVARRQKHADVRVVHAASLTVPAAAGAGPPP